MVLFTRTVGAAEDLTARKGRGSKPWKIVNKNTGEQKGSSETKQKAKASARIRDQRARD